MNAKHTAAGLAAMLAFGLAASAQAAAPAPWLKRHEHAPVIGDRPRDVQTIARSPRTVVGSPNNSARPATVLHLDAPNAYTLTVRAVCPNRGGLFGDSFTVATRAATDPGDATDDASHGVGYSLSGIQSAAGDRRTVTIRSGCWWVGHVHGAGATLTLTGGAHTVTGGPHDADRPFTIYTATPLTAGPYTVTVTANCTAADLARDPFRGYTDLRAASTGHPAQLAADVSTVGTATFTVTLPPRVEKLRIQSGCSWSLTAPDALIA
jgi:hypothetical protein